MIGRLGIHGQNYPHFRHSVGEKRHAESDFQVAKSEHPIPMLHLKVERSYLADANPGAFVGLLPGRETLVVSGSHLHRKEPR